MPNVKLVRVMDQRQKAWIYSRPGFDHSEIDMDKIGAMDMSLNSNCMLTFEVESSIIFRDFLFSIRPIFPWARSLRSAPLNRENLKISSEFEGGLGDSHIDSCISEIENGMPQDQARRLLPMTLETAYTVTMDFRTVCGLIKTIKELDRDLEMAYGQRFHREMEGIPGYKNNNIKSFVNSYLLTNEEVQPTSHNIGSMIFNVYKIEHHFASQFLRQSNSIVKTSIWNDIKQYGYLSLKDRMQLSLVTVCSYTSRTAYHNLMRLRSHWFADWSENAWGNIVGDYIKDMTINEFWDFIPNGNGKPDPYHRDMISRITGEEHNLPCPIMCEFPDLVSMRLMVHGWNPIIEKYKELVDAGFINDNPENKYRKMYLDGQQ